MKSLSNLLALIAVMLLGVSTGCNGNKFPVKPAKGKVVSGGQPVTTGSVTFTPMATGLETGKPATGAVGPDGTFTLSTFDRFDGAIVGKHSVHYEGFEGEDADEEGPTPEEENPTGKRPAKSQPPVTQRGEIIVEVTAAGPNDFTIDLSGAPAAQ